jgi:hypothetical protein
MRSEGGLQAEPGSDLAFLRRPLPPPLNPANAGQGRIAATRPEIYGQAGIP